MLINSFAVKRLRSRSRQFRALPERLRQSYNLAARKAAREASIYVKAWANEHRRTGNMSRRITYRSRVTGQGTVSVRSFVPFYAPFQDSYREVQAHARNLVRSRLRDAISRELGRGRIIR